MFGIKAQEFIYNKTINVASPNGIALEDDQYLYVCTTVGQQVKKIDINTGVEIFSLGEANVSGNDQSHFNNPYSVCLDKDKNIYIADRGNKRIMVHSPTATYLYEIDLGDSKPIHINIGPDEKLYVAHDGTSFGVLIINNLIIESHILTLTKDKFRGPRKVYFNNKSEIFIADVNTGIIKLSDFNNNTGTVDFVIKKENQINVAMKNESVTTLSDGRIIASSMKSKAPMDMGIYMYSKEGVALGSIGASGINSDNTGFNEPSDILVDSQDNLYVADSKNNRIQIWKYNDVIAPEINLLNTIESTTSSAKLSVSLSEASELFYLVKESHEVAPTADEISTPDVSAISGSISISKNQLEQQFTISGLQANKNYKVYALAKDASNNVSDIKISAEINTNLNILAPEINHRESTSVDLNFKATGDGTFYCVVELYDGSAPQFDTTGKIKNGVGAFKSFTLDYTTNQELVKTIDGLSESETYRISTYLETTDNQNTSIEHLVFSPLNDITRIGDKYKTLILGNQPDYNNSIIKERYNEIISYANQAHLKKGDYDPANAGPIMDLVNNSADIVIMRELCQNVLFPLALSYQLEGPEDNPNKDYKNANMLEDILTIYRYLIVRGFIKNCNLDSKGGGVYLRLTGYFYASFLMKEELKKANLFEDTIGMMEWGTNWIRPDNKEWTTTDKQDIKQSDRIRTMYNNRLLYTLSMPADSLSRVENISYLAKIYKEIGIPSQGWAGFLKPDFTGYHHNGVWGNAYFTGALHEATKVYYLFSDTDYKIGEQGIANLSKALVAYSTYTNKYDIPKSIAGRFPTALTAIAEHIPAFVYIYDASESVETKANISAAFARLYDNQAPVVHDYLIKKVKCDIMYQGGIGSLQRIEELSASNITAEQAPEGNWVFPYAGMQIHRRNNWMVASKGFSKYVWDFESNGEQNWFGRNQAAGALEIYASKNSSNTISAEASGYKEAGYDWNHVPGTTALNLTNWTDFSKSFPWAKFSPEYFLGGVSQNNNGVFAMKYVDVRKNTLKANKSVFYFHDLVVALGSDINNTNTQFDCHTTLFQNNLIDISVPNSINGISQTGLGLDYNGTAGQQVYFTDAVGNAYLMKNAKNLHITRKEQISRDNRDLNDTNGNWASAYINHEKNTNATYEYAILIQGEAKIAQMASNPEAHYSVIQQDSKAHIVKAGSQTGYAIFEAATIDKGIILASDDGCILMTDKIDINTYQLNVSQPDFGRYPRNEFPYQVWKIDADKYNSPSTTQPVNIKLKGKWQIKSGDALASLVDYDTNLDITTILFNCIDAKTIGIEISRTIAKQDQNINFTSPTDKVYGDAPFNLDVTSDSGLDVALTVSTNNATINGKTLTITTAGLVTIIASQAGNEAYHPASDVSKSFTVAKADQIISFDNIPDQDLAEGNCILLASATSNLPVSFQITSGNANINGNIITFTQSGEIRVTATQGGDQNYNAAPSMSQIFDVMQTTGIDDIDDNKINIYPNPASDFIIVDFPDYSNKEFSLYNNTGQLLHKEMANKQIKLNLNNLCAGIYIIKIKTEEQIISRKIIVNHN